MCVCVCCRLPHIYEHEQLHPPLSWYYSFVHITQSSTHVVLQRPVCACTHVCNDERYLKKTLRIEATLEKVENPGDTHLNMCAVLSELGRHKQALSHANQALIMLQEELFSPGDDGGQKSIPADRLAVLAIAYVRTCASYTDGNDGCVPLVVRVWFGLCGLFLCSPFFLAWKIRMMEWLNCVVEEINDDA